MSGNYENKTTPNNEEWIGWTYFSWLLLVPHIILSVTLISAIMSVLINLQLKNGPDFSALTSLNYYLVFSVASLIAHFKIGRWRLSQMSTELKEQIENRWNFRWSMTMTSSISIILLPICGQIGSFFLRGLGAGFFLYGLSSFLFLAFIISHLQLSAWLLYTFNIVAAEKISPDLILIFSKIQFGIFFFYLFMISILSIF